MTVEPYPSSDLNQALDLAAYQQAYIDDLTLIRDKARGIIENESMRGMDFQGVATALSGASGARVAAQDVLGRLRSQYANEFAAYQQRERLRRQQAQGVIDKRSSQWGQE